MGANPGTCTRSWKQLWIQMVCAVVSAAYSFGVTALIFKIMFYFRPRLETWEDQETTRDEISFNEVAYKMAPPVPLLDDPDGFDSDPDLGQGRDKMSVRVPRIKMAL